MNYQTCQHHEVGSDHVAFGRHHFHHLPYPGIRWASWRTHLALNHQSEMAVATVSATGVHPRSREATCDHRINVVITAVGAYITDGPFTAAKEVARSTAGLLVFVEDCYFT